MLNKREHDGPVTVAYGGGTNSLAVLIGFQRISQRVDLITFSDTGGEKPHTYEAVQRTSDWLVTHNMPPVTIVKAVSPRYGFEGLYGMAWRNETLPSKAFGYKSCSQRYKIEPQEKFLNHWQPAKAAWAAGKKILQVIGYDAGEPQRAKDYTNPKFAYWYPLIEWGWDREYCIEAIKEAGLPLPGKSACFYCPSMRKQEVIQIAQQYPDLYQKAIALEDRARSGGKLGVVKGLGRHWSWRELVEASEKQRCAIPENYMSTDCACYDGEEEG